MVARRNCGCVNPLTRVQRGARSGFACEPAVSTLPTSSRARACIPIHPKFPASSDTKSPARWTPQVPAWTSLGSAGCLALTRFGGYADVVVVPEKQVFEKPVSLSYEHAAAIPVNYLTAWQLLVVMGSLKPEETVLVHNAGGGVGLAAIDIARHIGATIYGTASSGKHAFLIQRGLHEAIDYRTKDWTVELNRLTNGKGVALITDPLGGNHWKKSYKALRSTGRLGMFGISVATTSRLFGPLRLLPVALGMPFFHPIPLMNTNKSAFGVNLGHMWRESEMIAGWMQILLKGVADGWVRPHVDKSFPLAQAGEAQTYLEERKNTGKVVLTV